MGCLEFSVYLVDLAGIREGGVVLFQKLDKFADLALAYDTNEHEFFLVRICAFRVQEGYAAMEFGKNFRRDVVGVVGDDFEFVAAPQTLQHIIHNDVGNENIQKSGNNRVDARIVKEKRQHDYGRIHDERKPCDIRARFKAFDERGNGIRAA